MEFISRVKAVLRRTNPQPSLSILSLGRLSMNIESHLVLVDGKEVILTFKEFELLKYMLENIELSCLETSF